MFRIIRPGVLIATAWLLLASCTSGHAVRTDTPPENTPTFRLPGLAKHAVAQGTIWFLAGPAASSANVFRVPAATGVVEQITANPQGRGVSWLSASTAGVVVADASTGVDQIGMLDPDTGQVERLTTGDPGTTVAFTPAISAQGRIAFSRAVYPSAAPATVPHAPNAVTPTPTAPPKWQIAVQGPDTDTVTVLYRGDQGVAAPEWGPLGRLAFLQNPGAHKPGATPALLVLDTKLRSVNRYNLKLDRASAVVWSTVEGTPVAVTDGVGASVLLDPASKKQIALPAGWVAQCWAPDGRSLLVSHGNKLALVTVDDPGRTTQLDAFPLGAVFGCSWVDTSK